MSERPSSPVPPPGPGPDAIPAEPDGPAVDPGSQSTARLVSASALMASGTLLSRVLGFGRLMLLVALFGNGTRQAEMFTLANTVPNSMYILLAGGVLNTVLVPQIVRAIKSDRDGGEAYTNRIMTAGILVLAVITVLLTFLAPLVIAVYSAPGWKSPELAEQYRSMVVLAYFCMPQVFFYGLHVLVGQVLNARDRFGPMMWSPIANNVVAIIVLLVYWRVFGVGDTSQPFSTGEEVLLGLGSTLGIALQAALLFPFLRAVGFRFRPRFDFKHTGLGKTFRLAKWTLGFVLVTQAALVVINRLASGATVGGSGAGLTAYANAYAVWILPHSLITVSLATAMLPSASRLAAAGDLAGVRDEALRTVRLALTALLPASVAFVALGVPMARVAFGFGQGERDADFVGWALVALGFGLVPFTVQYIFLRAFYSIEENRTTFFLQLVISGVNVAGGVAAVSLIGRPDWVATGLAGAYSLAYLVGVVVSFQVLRRRLPGLAARPLVRLGVRLLVAALPAGAVAFGITLAFGRWSASQPVRLLGLAVAGIVAVGVFLLASRLLKIREVADIVRTLLRRRRSGGPPGPGESGPSGDSAPGNPAGMPTIEPVHDPATRSAELLHAEGGSPNENAETMATSAAPQATSAGRDPGDSRTFPGPANPHPPSDPAADATQRTGPSPTAVAAGLPAGTVLGGRYRLEELLAEDRRTVSWRAFDQVLSRSVLVHLLPPDDEDTPDLLDVARRSSAATDARFLRVLDVVRADDPETGDYIVCEYATGQSLEAILTQGPLSGLEAAWVVREVADALAGVHAAGLHHERINPDTVIITPTGNVKIVGLLIERALRPTANAPAEGEELPPALTPELTDVRDLGRLLYACLVGRWPGCSAFGLPAAPEGGHGWLTPRQVRAGVSPALDAVCDQILGDPPRHRAEPIASAVGVVNALTKVLGPADASADLERRLRQPVPRIRAGEDLDQAETDDEAPAPPPRADRRAVPAATPRPATTEAAATTLIREPIPPAAPVRRHRRAGRLAGLVIGVLAAMALLAGGVVGTLILIDRNASRTAPEPSVEATTAEPTTATTPVLFEIAAARDFDPQGDPNTENPDQVRLAVDGDPATRWTTMTYRGSPKLGNLKRGVGIVVDLGRPQPVGAVRVSLSGGGTDYDVRLPKQDPAAATAPPMSSDAQWQVVGERTRATKTTEVRLREPVSSRFVLVYLTSLPREAGGYRGGIFEIEVAS